MGSRECGITNSFGGFDDEILRDRSLRKEEADLKPRRLSVLTQYDLVLEYCMMVQTEQDLNEWTSHLNSLAGNQQLSQHFLNVLARLAEQLDRIVFPITIQNLTTTIYVGSQTTVEQQCAQYNAGPTFPPDPPTFQDCANGGFSDACLNNMEVKINLTIPALTVGIEHLILFFLCCCFCCAFLVWRRRKKKDRECYEYDSKGRIIPLHPEGKIRRRRKRSKRRRLDEYSSSCSSSGSEEWVWSSSSSDDSDEFSSSSSDGDWSSDDFPDRPPPGHSWSDFSYSSEDTHSLSSGGTDSSRASSYYDGGNRSKKQRPRVLRRKRR